MFHHFRFRRDIKDLNRLREIASAFFMGGFSYLVKRAALKGCVSIKCRMHCLLKRKCSCPPGEHSLPVHFRRIIEGLGPTFVKLGQLLSLRPDVIPVEYCNELRKLQDDVPGFPYRETKLIIESEFKKPISQLFAHFGKNPIAAASIAQVHEARLKNGKKVAVKILRPDVEEIIERDIRIMEHAAELLEKHVEESRLFRPKRFVEEFKSWTMRELDFRNEARTMEEMGIELKKNKLIKIPIVNWDLTSSKVLTMEFLDGVRIDDKEELKKNRISEKKLAVNAIHIIVDQTLVNGLFHGDPHPGNILALKGNRLGFLDFGIIGRITERQKRKISLYLIHLFEKNFDHALNHIIDLAETSDDSDIAGFKRKALDILSACYGSIGKNSLSEALFRCIVAGVPHLVYFPSDLVLLSKAFVTTESVGRNLYPKFNILRDARRPVENILRKQTSPVRSIKGLVSNSLDYAELLEDAPIHAARMLKLLEKGSITVTINPKEFGGYMGEIHKANHVRMWGSIVAALIIASAITSFLRPVEQHMLSLPMIELYAAFLIGVWIFIYVRKTT